MKITSSFAPFLGAALFAAAAPGALAFSPRDGGGEDETVVLQFLDSSGQDPDGTARARFRDRGDEQDWNVELEDLPAGDYDLFVTDLATPKGVISVDGTGAGEIEFVTPQDGAKPLLDFAVDAQAIEVRQGATLFFSGTFSTTGAGGGGNDDRTKTAAFLVNVGPDFDAKGEVKYERKASSTRFSVEVERLDAGTYTIEVAGAPVGQLTTTSGESVEVEFRDPVEPGKTLLNFDPLGATVAITASGTTYLTAVLAAANDATGTKAPRTSGKGAKDLGKSKEDALLVYLASSGAQSGASGKATLRQSGETEFEVEIEDVTAGSYALCVDAVEVGTLVADSTGRAELRFSSAPGAGESLLDFEVKGKSIEVKDGAAVLLSTIFPTSVQAAAGKWKREIARADKVKTNLVNAGVDLDATGWMQWKQKGSGEQTLEIRVYDLPAGDYHVVANSVQSAATLVVAANGKGKLKFSTSPSGSRALLDFVAVDATIEITDASDVVVLRGVIDVP